MKTKLFIVGLLVVWGTGGGTDLLACGDKFLMAGRGTRFGKVAVARQPAAILIYASAASALQQALSDVDVDEVLRKAGYQPTTVSDPGQLEQALRQGGWDLVLAGLADSAALRGRLQGEAAPMVVPVMYRPTRGDLAQAESEYERVLKGPFKRQRFVEAVDEAVAQRAKSRTTA